MKKLMAVALLTIAGISGTCSARDVYVKPHVNRDGTYVQGHYRTAPDHNPYNNYSTQGNYNPYTGQTGTEDPYRQPSSNYADPYQSTRQCVKDIYGRCM